MNERKPFYAREDGAMYPYKYRYAGDRGLVINAIFYHVMLATVYDILLL